MTAARTIIEDALLELGVGALGEPTDQEVVNHGLRVLNRMLASWSAEIRPIFASSLDTHTWPSGSASQTIGSGGDIDTVRPIEITGFQTRKDTLDYTLEEVSYEQYQTTILKTISTDYPDVFAFRRTYPLATIYIFPVPSNNLSCFIQSKKALDTLTIDETLSLPDGYEEALVTNLAMMLAPAHGTAVKRETEMAAKLSKQAIIDVNKDDSEMWPDYTLPGFRVGDDINQLTNK